MRYYCVFFSLCLTFSLKKFQGSLLIFSIVQFSRCCCRFLDSFIISHFEVFVKSFWKLFQINFFNVIVTPKSDLIIVPQLVRFVKSFFQKPFRLNCESSVLQTTYLLYHFRTILSSIFLNFFQKNFWKLVFQSPKTSFWKGFRPTALLLYHNHSNLSTLFREFF